jgi:hypothetical protein
MQRTEQLSISLRGYHSNGRFAPDRDRDRTNHLASKRTEPSGAENYQWCLEWAKQQRDSHTARPRKCTRGHCQGAPCNQKVPPSLEQAMAAFLRAGGRATSVVPVLRT